MLRRLELWAVDKIGKDSRLGKSLGRLHRPVMDVVYRRKIEKTRERAEQLSRHERESFEDLQSVCMFIGYPRSGHSLVGALIDAHPNAIIAHELGVLNFVKRGFTRGQIFSLILANSREYAERGRAWSGYSYEVPGQWQGRYRKLTVIGDKKGGVNDDRLQFLPALNELAGVEVRILHVVRNPFDAISTMSRKTNPYSKEPEKYINQNIEEFFELAEKNEVVRTNGTNKVLDIWHEDLILDPRGTLRKICEFYGLEPEESYIEAAAGIVFEKPNKSRERVKWTEEQKAEILERMGKFEFLQRYSFES
ncbi:sulfotransferase [Patescibacteria group bacterium]|nr:sulfotransferase [Patescibacteria group bacterium]